MCLITEHHNVLSKNWQIEEKNRKITIIAPLLSTDKMKQNNQKIHRQLDPNNQPPWSIYEIRLLGTEEYSLFSYTNETYAWP